MRGYRNKEERKIDLGLTLGRKYVPSNYKQQLYVQWNTLNQRNRNVAEYIQEWEKLYVLCEVTETDEMRVGKFLAGLKDEISRKLITIPNLTLQLACNMSLTIEQNMVKKRTPFNTGYNRTPRTTPSKPVTSSSPSP